MENTLKLLLLLIVTLLLCINSAAGVTCQLCTNDKCSNPSYVSCDFSSHRCMAATFQVTKGGKTTTHIFKDCVDNKLCSKAQTYSLTTKDSSVLAQVKCCSSDLCNDKLPTIPPVSTGTLQCSNSDPGDDKCTSPIKCNSLETKCFSARVDYTDTTQHGCASANACDSGYMPNHLLHKATGELLDGSIACKTACPSPPLTLSLQCDMSFITGQSSMALSVTAPPGMMCMAAKVTSGESSSVLELKGIAGAPLCSSEGSKTYSQDSTQDSTDDSTQDSTQDSTEDSTQDSTDDSTQDSTQDSTDDSTQDSTQDYNDSALDSGSTILIQVRCCNSNNCNRDAPEEEFPDSVQSCSTSTDCPAGLIQQVTQLTNGHVIVPPN